MTDATAISHEDGKLLVRIDERTTGMEKRLARLEIGYLAVLIGAAYIVLRVILMNAGLPTP